jgi:hypothetical protein
MAVLLVGSTLKEMERGPSPFDVPNFLQIAKLLV